MVKAKQVITKVKEAGLLILTGALFLMMWMIPVYANTGDETGNPSSEYSEIADPSAVDTTNAAASPDISAVNTSAADTDGRPESQEAAEDGAGSEGAAASGLSDEASDSEGSQQADPPLTAEEAAASTGGQSGSSSITPEGSMTLVDDLDGENREFLTVTTKDGNYFYLIIDKNDNGTGNVYFLNKVDETDLMALMDDSTASEVQAHLDEKEKAAEEAVSAVSEGSEETDGQSAGGDNSYSRPGSTDTTFLERMVILLGCFAAAGIILYAVVSRKKKKGEGQDPADSYDDDYDDEYDFPEEEEETRDEDEYDFPEEEDEPRDEGNEEEPWDEGNEDGPRDEDDEDGPEDPEKS